MKLLLLQEKVQSITQSCQWLMKQPTVTICQLCQLLGRMTAAAPAVLSAPIWYCHLQCLKIQSLKQLKSFDRQVTLDKKTVEELQWWSVHLITWNGKDIIQAPLDLVIDRCIPTGLGSNMQGSADRWPVVQGRTGGTHQCTGADGRHVYSASFCEEQAEGPCLPQDGQHISPILHDQDGGHTVYQTDRGRATYVGLVPPPIDNSLSINTSQV